MSRLLISLFAALTVSVSAYSLNAVTDGWESVLEILLSDESISSYDREELCEFYESIHETPLNINTATREELAQLPFLTYEQIEDIHAYIYMHGPMLTLGELQLTGGLDLNTCQILRHFVYAGDVAQKKENPRMADILRNGRNEFIARADIPLYIRDGFRYHSPQELKRYPNRKYLGTPLSHSLRYSFNWNNRIRLGITADKDAGEPSYDFWSPYLYLKDTGVFKELAIGKFKAMFGHGLLLGSGFNAGKSMALSSMSRNAQGLKPHSSTQEYGYLSGAGAAVSMNHVTVTMLGAYTRADATLKGDTVISFFKEDGYHRTQLEWSKKRNIALGTLAANIRYSYRGTGFGVTALAERLSHKYRGAGVYTGLSADGFIRRSRYALTAEFSVCNGQTALLASQTVRLRHSWSLNTVLRRYSPDYNALHSNSISEGGTENETGLLMGLNHKSRRVGLSGYADLFMHPQPRSGASHSSNGMELRLETDWNISGNDRLYGTFSFKSKQKDCAYTDRLEYCITCRCRLRWTHNCHNGAQLKTQCYYARYDFIAQPVSNGFALSENYSRSLYKDRLSIDLTCIAFYTQSYDSHVSVYESGLRYAYNFMTLSGKGGRMAVTARYRIGRNMQINLKAGGTIYTDRDEIGSAQQRIDSNHKEDVSLQLIAKF